MVIVHCAFGLWMHTYFKAELAALDVVAAATGAINDQVGGEAGKPAARP